MATHHFTDSEKIAEASAMMAGRPMDGLEIETLDVRMDQRGW
jgi:pyridoxal biosynthesis lyase PdxS